MTLPFLIIKDLRNPFLIFTLKELIISKTTESSYVASYPDLLFIRDDSNKMTTKLYDKRDVCGFHTMNFAFMSSNIPSAPIYGVYASLLICYAVDVQIIDSLSRHMILVTRHTLIWLDNT